MIIMLFDSTICTIALYNESHLKPQYVICYVFIKNPVCLLMCIINNMHNTTIPIFNYPFVLYNKKTDHHESS